MTDDYAVHGIASWALICEWAAAAEVPVYFVGQGVGPVTGEGRRGLAQRALQQARLLTVREPYSHDAAKALGVSDAHLSMTPDWACANLPTPADRARAEQLHLELAGGSPYLAISVHRRGSTTKLDLERLSTVTRDLVAEAASRGLRTIIVPNMTGERYNDDRATFDMLASDWPASVPEAPVLRTRESSRVVRALLGRSEGIVSTRYHPIVFALAEGVGAAGLSFDPYYDQKLAGVFRTFDCEEAVFSLGAASIDACTVLDTVKGMQVASDIDLYDRVVGPFRSALMERTAR